MTIAEPGLERDDALLVGGEGDGAERTAGAALGEGDLAVGRNDQRRRVAGAGVAKGAGLRVEHGVEHRRHPAALELLGEGVGALEHDGGAQALERVGADRALQMRHPGGGGDPAADDVADHQAGLAVA